MRTFLLTAILVTLCLIVSVYGAPKEDGSSIDSEEGIDTSTTNNTEKDLYIIRKVVYEIGILTDPDNSTDFDNRTHEQVDVSFFDPIDNGTFVDLSNIPVPVETNVSGVSVTGILSSNLGSLIFPENGNSATLNESSFALFPDKQVKVTRNVSIVDKGKSLDFLSGISDVLGLSNLVESKNKEKENDTESSS